jgi:two-component system chemotaxis response regulator CheB
MSVIRAVIADDSALLRMMLADVLAESKRIEVVGQACNGKEAVRVTAELRPDVLVLDCEMPVMTGLEALQEIMQKTPVPVFMFSSLTREGAQVTVKALELGAVDFLPKPAGGPSELKTIANTLIQKVTTVVVKGRNRLMASRRAPAVDKEVDINKTVPVRDIDIIAIGSSTGGVKTGVELIKSLPADLPPVVWVQHMPPAFTKSFAERLNGVGALSVKEAHDGDILRRGWCYLAPGGYQMQVIIQGAAAYLEVGGTDKINGHCPSCNVLFDSVARHYSRNALGVILTGMGDDGTKGLLKMHQRGAWVIGQNEATCVVYGMPKSAFNAGAVDLELNITQMSEAIVRICGRNRHGTGSGLGKQGVR